MTLFDQPHILLLQRIDAAIVRMELLPESPTVAQSIANLKTKRGWVEADNYVIRQINQEAVAAIGREIGMLTKATGLRSPFVGKKAVAL